MNVADATLVAAAIAAIVLLRMGLWMSFREGAGPAERLPASARDAISRTAAIAALVGLPLGFLVLAVKASEPGGLAAVDTAIVELVARYRSETLVSAFGWITQLGDTASLAAVAIVATGVLWAHGPRDTLVPVWFVIIGAEGTTWTAKFVIDRARPEFLFDVAASSPSFPSGHATGSLALYGILAYVIARGLETRRARFEVAYWAGVVIVLISFSRIYVNVHHPTDVFAGLIVGGFWLVIGILSFERVRHLLPALRQ